MRLSEDKPIWIVELGFIRPLAVAVMALLMLVPVDFSFAMMDIDIVPASKLPVAMLVYTSTTTRRAFFITDGAYSTSVNGIAPSNPSRSKIGLKRIYFNSGHTAEG